MRVYAESWCGGFVAEVPDFQVAIGSDVVEYSGACGTPASSSDGCGGVGGADQWCLQIFVPDACCPVSQRQKVLWKEGISSEAVDRGMMPVEYGTHSVTWILGLAIAV